MNGQALQHKCAIPVHCHLGCVGVSKLPSCRADNCKQAGLQFQPAVPVCIALRNAYCSVKYALAGLL